MKRFIFLSIALFILAFSSGTYADWWNDGEYSTDVNTIALWHCNQNSGTTVTDATGNFDGTSTSDQIWDSNVKKWGSGACGFDKVYYFSNDTLWDDGLPNEFTAEFWLYLLEDIDASLPVNHSTWGKYNDNTGGARDWWNASFQNGSGYLLTQARSNETAYNLAGVQVDWNAFQWYHIAYIFDGTTMALYVDGVKDAGAAYAPMEAGSFTDFYFGTTPFGIGTEIINAIIDEIRFSDVNRAEFPSPPVSADVVDINSWRVNGFDESQVAYPKFSYLNDLNLTIDFNVFNKDNNRMTVDINYGTETTQGTGTIIVSDLNLSAAVCSDQDFTTISSCSWDWNISSVADNNYFLIFSLDSGSVAGNATDNTDNSLRIMTTEMKLRFLDENTSKPIQNLSVLFDDTTYTTEGDGIITVNLSYVTPGDYTIQAWQDDNYGTRYFEYDINQTSGIDANLSILRDVNGQVVEFVFYDSDQTTLLANKRMHFYYNGVGAIIAGIRTTDASGATSLFMNPDRNYYFIAQQGDDTQIRYDRVNATFNIPKDEDSLAGITPFDVKQSGIGLIDYANQSANIELYLFPNTVSYYTFDTNGGNAYLTRKKVVKYLGNPATATIQVYLPNVDNGVESVFFTKDSDLSTVPGIRIVVFKNIEGAGTAEVQSVITDDAGTATMSFIIDDLYSFDVYDEDDVFVFSFELRPNFTSYYINLGTASLITTPTELEYIFVLGIPNERYIAFDSSGYDINITVDVNNGTIATSWFTVSNDDGNITFNTSCGSSCSYHLELPDLNNTMDLTVTVFVETASGLKYLNSWTFVPYDSSGYNLVATLQSCDFKQGFGCDCDSNVPCFFLLMVAVFLMIATVLAIGRTITTDRSALGIVVVIEMSIFTYFTWIPAGFFILATLAVFAGLVLSRRDF